MSRSSFVSFHYQLDHWRVQQILKIGALDNQVELPSQDWEEVRKKGDAAVEAWIDKQMNYKQAVIVMIGSETASRKFVKYEIKRAWSLKKPLLGIKIHGLKNSSQEVGIAGPNPFTQFGFNDSDKTYADFIPVFNPADYATTSTPTSTDVYAAIKTNIGTWATSGYRRP